MLEVKNVSVRAGNSVIADGVSFSVGEGEWVMLVGPNGAGKTTLVGAVSQTVPYTGSVLFEGRDVARMKPAAAARLIGVLTQSHHVEYSFSACDIVRMGRYCHAPSVFSRKSDEDERAVEEALQATGVASFAARSVLTLSGGELQRVFLAQVFAQNPRLLILDEPANHLDLVYQKQVFELISQWLKKPGRAVLSVVHDLGLAMTFGTRAVLLDEGRLVSQGALREVLSADNLKGVYRMDVGAWMRKLLSVWEES